ncbi:phosphoenolpyruvate synthase [Betaproteobacteria bacterium GR16-43]|nr:phosphoenolpyruvate synthase [Betaproteobacteria bacterium GR16-43]
MVLSGRYNCKLRKARFPMSAHVLPLEKLRMTDVASVGGKNASLGELISQLAATGVRVPGGFATTARAFEEFLDHNQLKALIDAALDGLDVEDVQALAKTGAKVRAMVEAAVLPPALVKAIHDEYARVSHGTPDASFAVRSSATAEDLPDASFAGQQETYLNIRGIENVLEAVKRVFASLYNDRAIAYRVHKNFKHEDVAISAGVQRMVRSDLGAAGVMFTMDTESGFREVVFITASYGLGETVVQGSVNPDEFYVSKKCLADGKPAVLRRTLGSKAIKLVFTADPKPGASVEEKQVAPGDRDRFSLSDSEVEELARYAMAIERHYARPMDIEWGRDGSDGKLYILQARPETVKSQETAKRTLTRYRLGKKGDVLAEGRAIGSKIGQGKVRVIVDVSEIARVQDGDILVTDMTDPNWEPVMKRASAIVTNRGGRTCFSGDTRLLTNVGFMTFSELAERGHEGLSVPSLNRTTLKIEWKPVLAVMKRVAGMIRVGISQTGRTKGNDLKLTPDHKMLALAGGELVDREMQDILARQECVLLAQQLPQLSASTPKEHSLAYLLGGLMTDGHVYLSATHGEVTFIQKPEVAKLNFIARMNEALQANYGKAFKASAKKVSSGFIRGKQVVGSANAYRCYSKAIATAVRDEQDSIVTTLLKSDVEVACHFLAGVIDGDGSYREGRVHVYVSGGDMLEAVMVACFRIGIVPVVCVNRSIYNVQIVEKLDLLGRYTSRIHCRDERGIGSRFFNTRELLPDTVNSDVNNRVRKNLLIDAAGLRGHLPAVTDDRLKGRIEHLLASDVRQARVALEETLEEADVYNITVADNHNYIVFTERYTPVLANNCHAAIIARELGVPAVVGCEDATEHLKEGTEVTVSCAEGDTGFIYAGKVPFEVIEVQLDKMPKIPVKIAMNVGNPQLAFDFSQLPNEGVGLARLEFIISNTIGIHPKACLEYDRLQPELKAQVAKQSRGYASPTRFYVDKIVEGVATIAAAFWPKKVIVRMSDFKSNEYRNLIGGAKYEPNEENPMLGFRGASRYIAPSFRECFKLECEAMKRVRDEMGLTNVEIMIPFVRTLKESEQVHAILRDFGLERGRNGLRVVMMCEIPSNAILADEFLKHYDGFSIGSNDMTQLTLALDRDSGLVMEGFDERDAAVKAMLHLAIQACRKAKKYVGICGQGPSDYPDLAEWLMSEGIESMSLNPDTVVETWLHLAKASEKVAG